MKHSNISFLLILFMTGLSLSIVADESLIKSESKSEAEKIVKAFSGILKPKLKMAIKTGGLEHAIKICSVEAPKIAKELSEKTGWKIRRVSLKPRNKSSASPDAFEKNILQKFDNDQAEGTISSAAEYSEIVDNQFRYMKAQSVEGVCLNCHGSLVSEDVKKMIKKHYPKDIALGYSLGQIRGAFSLVKDL